VAPSKLPKPTQETKDYFASIVPEHPAVTIRPMFGLLSAFVNGNMFMEIFGEDVLVRLPEEDRAALLREGGRAFEPIGGTSDEGVRRAPGHVARRARTHP
jgi:TfoX/Sxy family transcriptional regulator of competence genes